jgi:hypothetical protein
MYRITEVAAWAWVHGRRQHEARGVGQTHGSATEGDHSIFKRLPEDLEHIPPELWQLVEEEHTSVSKAHFAWPRGRAAADQASITDGVVRRAKRSLSEEGEAERESSSHAVNLRGLECLLQNHRG